MFFRNAAAATSAVGQNLFGGALMRRKGERAMADTTKLAGTFKAWKLTFGAKPEKVLEALARCRELGLQPRLCGDQGGYILLQVFVPNTNNEDSCPQAFQKEMNDFHWPLFHGAKTYLVCPPSVQVLPLLTPVSTIHVPAIQRFVCDDETLKAANIHTGENFDRLFKGKVEKNISSTTLTAHKLNRRSLDPPILTEFGDCAQTALAHMVELVKKQKNGEPGILLTDGCANIFYLIDSDSNIWAVNARRYFIRRYWDVEAYSVEYPRMWIVGIQAFSRNS